MGAAMQRRYSTCCGVVSLSLTPCLPRVVSRETFAAHLRRCGISHQLRVALAKAGVVHPLPHPSGAGQCRVVRSPWLTVARRLYLRLRCHHRRGGRRRGTSHPAAGGGPGPPGPDYRRWGEIRRYICPPQHLRSQSPSDLPFNDSWFRGSVR